MKVSIKYSVAVLTLLANHDLRQLENAVKSAVGEQGIEVAEELRSVKWKQGKKDVPHKATIKATDKGSLSVELVNNPAMSFFAFNLAILEMEACGLFCTLAELPLGIARWVSKFELTEEVKAERARKVALQARLDKASADAREKALAEAQAEADATPATAAA